MATQISEYPSKTVNIRNQIFEIPAYMTKASMVECWQSESKVLEAFVKSIVDFHPHLAFDIVHAYCEKNNNRLVDIDPDYDELIAWLAVIGEENQRKAGVKFTDDGAEPALYIKIRNLRAEDSLEVARRIYNTVGPLLGKGNYSSTKGEIEDFINRCS